MTGKIFVGKMTGSVGVGEMSRKAGEGGRNMRVVVWGNDQGYWCGGDVWWGEA